MSSDIDFDSLAIKKKYFHISYNCLHFKNIFNSIRNTTDDKSSLNRFAYLDPCSLK